MMVQEGPENISETSDESMRKTTLESLLGQNVTMGSIVKRNVVSLDHTQTAYDAALLMIKKGVGCIIVTAYDKPFGMITERDIVCTVAGLNIPLRALLLSYLASRPLICAKSCQTIEEASAIMKKYRIRRLPVVDGDMIVGLVTARDLAMCLSSMPENRVCRNGTSKYIKNQKNAIEELIDLVF